MRVAQLIENLNAGGAETVAVSIANALAGHGHDSHLIVVHGGGELRAELDPSVQYLDLDRPRTAGPWPQLLAYRFGTCRRLQEVLSRHRIEVVQCHLPLANFIGLWVGYRRLARVHPTIHNNLEFRYGSSSRGKIAARRLAYRLMLRWCDGMIAVSEQVKRSMCRELGIDGTWRDRHIVAIPNGVPIPREVDIVNRESHRNAWGIDPDTVLIMGIGRLVEQKGFDAMLQALAMLRESPAPWVGIIAGEGEERPALERMIRTGGLGDRVRLVGYVPAIRNLVQAADIVCLTSKYEGLPLVLLEAMAAARPVCATRIDGTADVVADGREAMLVEPDDIAGLARELGRLVGDRQLRDRLGLAGRQLVRERYSLERQIAALEALYGNADRIHGTRRP